MSMRVVDQNFVNSSQANIALMTAQMNNVESVSFADLRANVNQFANLNDGELSQIAVDAGFEVMGD